MRHPLHRLPVYHARQHQGCVRGTVDFRAEAPGIPQSGRMWKPLERTGAVKRKSYENPLKVRICRRCSPGVSIKITKPHLFFFAETVRECDSENKREPMNSKYGCYTSLFFFYPSPVSPKARWAPTTTTSALEMISTIYLHRRMQRSACAPFPAVEQNSFGILARGCGIVSHR